MRKKPDDIDVEVGQRICIQRLQCGLPQTALAKQLGVTVQQVLKYEKGVNLGAGRLTKIAKVLSPHSSALRTPKISKVATARPPRRSCC